MTKLELWGGIFAAIGGIFLAIGSMNTYFVLIAYAFFMVSAILLTIWSIKLKFKGIIIMNITYLLCDVVGIYLWIGTV